MTTINITRATIRERLTITDHCTPRLIRGLQPGDKGYATGRQAQDGEPACIYGGCYRVAARRSRPSFCIMHEARARKTGSPGAAGPHRPYAGRRECRVADCTARVTYADSMLCKSHGRAHRLYGDPTVKLPPGRSTGPDHPNVKDVPGYDAVHVRLKQWRGQASEFACIDDCGRQAAEWSYVGGDLSELTDRKRGIAYSLDLARYAPRCYPCHRAHDLAARGGRRSRAA